MSLSIRYVMLHVTFHHQPHHQQNHNVHVHGKVTLVSVQKISALSLRNALISMEWLMRLRRPVVSSLHNAKARSTNYKGLHKAGAVSKPLQVWLDHAVAGRPL